MRFPNLENPYSPETVVPVLRMYGARALQSSGFGLTCDMEWEPTRFMHFDHHKVTEEGHSLMAHIHGFEPYFYVECPEVLSALACAQ